MEMKAVSPEEAKKLQAELKREVLKQRGAEIAEDAGKFVADTAKAAKAGIGKGVSGMMDRLGKALSGAWSGLGKAAGATWDGALLGLGYGAVAKDKTVEAAGAAKKVAVETAGKAKDLAVEGAKVTRDAVAAGYDHMTDMNKSETVQAYRDAKRMAGEGAEYVAGKAGEAKEYVVGKAGEAAEYATDKYNAAKDSVLATGKAIIESKAARYTAKGLKYAGIGAGTAIGVPLAAGAYAIAGPMLAWKNPEALNAVRTEIKDRFPVMGMNVGEAIEKVGASISEKGRELATRAWDKMTNAWDGLKAWGNDKRVAAMEKAGIASTADVKKAMNEAAELRAQLNELRAQMSSGSKTQSGNAFSG